MNAGGTWGTDSQADPEAGAYHRQLILTPASTIAPKRAKWLWAGRIALGTLALLAGREGIGKSTITYWIAARITKGELPGECWGKPRSVIVSATEDSWAHTIVPRLIAAGADLELVFRIEATTITAGRGELLLPSDIDRLQVAAMQLSTALLILDPLVARLGELDTHKDAEVRKALEPLTRVAEIEQFSIIGLMHHNKGGGGDPLQLVMGSKAFTAVARSVHTVVPDPDDDDKELCWFGTAKNNLGPVNTLPLLSYRTETYLLPLDDDPEPCVTSRVKWGEESMRSMYDLMTEATQTEGPILQWKEIADWILDHLEAEGGSADRPDIIAAANKLKYAQRTVEYALTKLTKAGKVTSKRGFQQAAHYTLATPSSSDVTNP